MVIDPYYGTDSALTARLEISNSLYIEDEISKAERNQLLYNDRKGFLMYHPTSINLLNDLSKLGFKTHPREVIDFCDRSISINKNNFEPYIYSSLAYQILEDYNIALSKLVECRDILFTRLTSELRKGYPYPDEPKLKSKSVEFRIREINIAKKYLRGIGLDTGKYVVVNRKLRWIPFMDNPAMHDIMTSISSVSNNPYGTDPIGYPFPCDSSRSEVCQVYIKDLHTLENVLHQIDRINSGNPYMSSRDRVDIIPPSRKNYLQLKYGKRYGANIGTIDGYESLGIVWDRKKRKYYLGASQP